MMQRFFHAILLLTSLTLGSQLYAQSQAFEAGYQAYMRNQFPVAEAHFKRALSASKTSEDRAFILKFLGISQYMRGDRKQAANSFYQAYMNDQKTSIYQEEVLDPTVVDFYNSLKIRWSQAQARQRQQDQSKEITAPTLPSSRPSSAPQAGRAAPAGQPLTKTERLQSTQRATANSKRKNIDSGGASSSRPIHWLHFVPFGAGQFYHGQYFAGSFFLGTQIFAGATYVRRHGQISDETSKRNYVVGLDGIDELTRTEFLNEIDDRISLLEKEAGYAMLGFGLSWGVGVLHAILSAPKIMTDDLTLSTTRSQPALSLQHNETLDSWYVNKSPSQNYFAISPRANGGWLLNVSIDLH